MSKKDLVKNYLEKEPLFRLRSNKHRGIVNLLLKCHPTLDSALRQEFITKTTLTAFVQDYNTLDRIWRKTLEENPNLRGSDYDEKDEREAHKLKELGYRVNDTGPREVGDEDRQPNLI